MRSIVLALAQEPTAAKLADIARESGADRTERAAGEPPTAGT
jgi:hypothetical protein